MSEANRKRMYDELVKAKRFDDIDPQLEKEFGTLPKTLPKAEEKPKKLFKKKGDK